MAGSREVISYAELDRRSIQVPRLLQSRGLATGDHVAILAENHPRYFEVTWGALRPHVGRGGSGRLARTSSGS